MSEKNHFKHWSFGVLSLGLVLAACGGGNNATSTVTVPVGQYSLASLSGQYAVSIGDTASLYLDGAGHIDPSRSSISTIIFPFGIAPPVPVSGSYTVDLSGRGMLKMKYVYANTTESNSQVLSFIILKDGSAAFSEMDAYPFSEFTPPSGYLRKQNSSAFTIDSIRGSYVYGGCGATAGWFDVDSMGNFTGFDDLNGPFTGSMSGPPDKGTGLVDASSLEGNIYIVDKGYVLAGPIPPAEGGGGNGFPCGLLKKSSTPPSPSIFKGRYVMVSPVENWNETSSDNGFVARGGIFSADGVSSVSGVEDIVTSSSASTVAAENNHSVSGTFTLASSGAGSLTLGPPMTQFPLYANSPDAFMFVVRDTSSADLSSGTLLAQEDNNFATSTLKGTYAVRLDGAFSTMIAQLTFDGGGSVTGIADLGVAGIGGSGLDISNDMTLQGSYSVESNGRGKMTLSSFRGRSNFVIYMISPSRFAVIGLEDETPLSGMGEQ